MSSPLVRCFWAVCPPDECLEQVAELVRVLKRPLSELGLQVAWTARAGYHLTLQFLGDVDEGQLGAMVAQVQAQLGGGALAVPQLGLAGLGVFPGPQRPQVLFVGARAAADGGDAVASGSSPELQTLQERLAGWLAPLGHARDERLFHPHLTIGRVRGSAQEAELQAALPTLLQRYAAHRCGATFPVTTLILYESQPAPSGPKYSPLARLPIAPGRRAPGPLKRAARRRFLRKPLHFTRFSKENPWPRRKTTPRTLRIPRSSAAVSAPPPSRR